METTLSMRARCFVMDCIEVNGDIHTAGLNCSMRANSKRMQHRGLFVFSVHAAISGSAFEAKDETWQDLLRRFRRVCSADFGIITCGLNSKVACVGLHIGPQSAVPAGRNDNERRFIQGRFDHQMFSAITIFCHACLPPQPQTESDHRSHMVWSE